AFLTPMRVTVAGRERIDPEQSYVIVANHQSPYDIYVLYGWLGIDFKWVLKQELRKVPGLGIGCEKLGHIYVDRSNSHAAIRSINEARERITRGTSVIFFAEGTFGNGRELLAFKKGAFRMALDLGLPILPVTIVGTREILPGGSWDLFPGRAKLIVHEPMEITGHEPGKLRPLIQEVRAVVQSGLDPIQAAAEP
ncbi:MAG: 1-acyl-sn-glycerol-3-phosphate acyltransferase, partial [bacterium]|nr:1-acyl-sn-glycerol-3-phosphate acyltransferase [bacterium]